LIPPPVNDCLLILHDGKDHYNWVMKNGETLLSTDKRHANSSTQLPIDTETSRKPFSIEITELKKKREAQKQIDGKKQTIEKRVDKKQSVLSFSSITSKSNTIGNVTKKRKLVPNVDHVPIVNDGKMQSNNISSSQISSATYLTTTFTNTNIEEQLNNMNDDLIKKNY